MTTANLHEMFTPRSVAVIGASDRPGAVGAAVMKNLMANRFPGRIIPVNPVRKQIQGILAVPDIRDAEGPVDLALVATPIQKVPEIIESCGIAGVAGAVILSAGGKEIGTAGQEIEAKILACAARHGVRIIGPNCLGIVNTQSGLNAGFAHMAPLPGNIAFLSQSGAVCTSILDLAIRENVGFSHFVSLGSMLDVDFADMIDYLGNLSSVRSIVMYMENMTHIRNFMSAARSVSRLKPIIVLKSGRSRAGARAAASHTGAMAGEDAVYDAAFARAGVLRVNAFEELLDCSEFLAKQPRPSGSRLTIVTNAGGPGVMAADALEFYGLEPAPLGAETLGALDRILPSNWSRVNPVDILGDTSIDRYVQAVKICGAAPETDALLLMCAPAGTMDTLALAQALIPVIADVTCPVLTAWIGGDNVIQARQAFNRAGIVTCDSAERAVRAFNNLYRYGRNIQALQEIPIRTDTRLQIERDAAAAIVTHALDNSRSGLLEHEAKALVQAYGIPVTPTRVVTSAEAARDAAREMGGPVVLKICSRDILHKSDCNGVMLNLTTPDEAARACEEILSRARERFPDARIDGVTIQPMLPAPDYELIIGAKKDPQFGPILLFGMGGVFTEIFADTAMGLPPLNRPLAARMIRDTRVAKVLGGFRHVPPVDMALLEELLIRTARLVTDFPEIQELDINPLMVTRGALTAVDARVILAPSLVAAPGHLIISSYPWQYEHAVTTVDDHPFFIRPIRPSDADLLLAHFNSLSPHSVYMRFFSPMRQLSREMLVRLTQIDYDREIALVALMGEGSERRMVGVCRIITQRNVRHGEFALAITDNFQGKGIGAALLSRCLDAAWKMKIQRIYGVVLAENTQMLKLARKLGFTIERSKDGPEYELTLERSD